MAYVYRHIRLDKNEPFYIGIGSDDKYSRAKSLRSRSDFWHKIAKLHQYRVEIMIDDITFDEAKIKEKEFISLYGRKDLNTGTLCNMTDGGDGTPGYIVPREKIEMLRVLNTGKKHSEESKLKMSVKLKGENHPRWGKKISEETRLKMSLSRVNLGLKGSNSPNAKKVIDCVSGQIFNCIEEAATYYKIKIKTLTGYLSGRRTNKTNLKYFNNNEHDYQENIIRN